MEFRTSMRVAALSLLFATQPAFAEDSRQIALTFAEAFGAGDVATLERIVSEDVMDHTLPPGGIQGRKALIDAVAFFRSAFLSSPKSRCCEGNVRYGSWLRENASAKVSGGARLNPTDIAANVELQQHRRMIGRPTGRLGIDPTEPKIAQIEFVDKDVDHPNGIVLKDPVFQAFAP